MTPKLIWTKRIVTGDVLTAQEWLDGRTLKRFEMDNRQVARLLGRVHNSDLLKKMLTRMGGAPEEPKTFLNRLALDTAVKQMPVVQRGLSFLQQLPEAPRAYRVCHGDLSHKNWLISNQKQLYLVDWDQAVLSDVAYDLSFIWSIMWLGRAGSTGCTRMAPRSHQHLNAVSVGTGCIT